MKKIVVVDEEDELRTAIKIRLEVEGYQVITASNGKECLEVAKEKAPDLIILDIMMPVMDGYTALRFLKDDPYLKKIPVIILTIKEKIKMEGLFFLDMVSDYVEKPFETEVLLDKVKEALSKGGERDG
jgi:CheY-like chemotaxis protein